jgi:hypothetical protein
MSIKSIVGPLGEKASSLGIPRTRWLVNGVCLTSSHSNTRLSSCVTASR